MPRKCWLASIIFFNSEKFIVNIGVPLGRALVTCVVSEYTYSQMLPSLSFPVRNWADEFFVLVFCDGITICFLERSWAISTTVSPTGLFDDAAINESNGSLCVGTAWVGKAKPSRAASPGISFFKREPFSK